MHYDRLMTGYSTFQSLQIIAAYLFMKIDQYLMPAPIIERQSEGVV